MSPRVITMSYGPWPDQVGDLYLPQVPQPPVVCLLHGGYWRMPWGRDHIAPLAVSLTQLGFAVWNIEYRRVDGAQGEVGAAGGGWPGTLQDVAAAIDHLAICAPAAGEPAAGEPAAGAPLAPLDLDRVIVVGHSAGGQLALWAAATGGQMGPRRVRVRAAVGLAPVADLQWAYEHRCGNGAVQGLLGGTPEAYPERYREASPIERLPLVVRQLVLHGTPDEDVPVEISRRYARAAAAVVTATGVSPASWAADRFTFMELPDVPHMDFVDPASGATAVLFEWLTRHALTEITC